MMTKEKRLGLIYIFVIFVIYFQQVQVEGSSFDNETYSERLTSNLHSHKHRHNRLNLQHVYDITLVMIGNIYIQKMKNMDRIM